PSDSPLMTLRKYLALRLDYRCYTINSIFGGFLVDDDRYSCLSRRIDDFPDDPRRQRALGIIRQHDAPRSRQRRKRAIDQNLLSLRIDCFRQFPIGALKMG